MLWITILILTVGCAATAEPATGTTQPTQTATVEVVEAATAAPPTPEAMDPGIAGQLVARHAAALPDIDGQVEEAWAAVDSLRIPLTWGFEGTEHALDVALRAVYTDQAIAFLAQWSGEPPTGVESTVFNKLTVHWRIPEQAAQGLDCTVVCHTAFAGGDGRFAYANAETIPHGGHEALDAAGGWDGGTWTLEWSRPLVSGNPFDVQFDDRAQAITFLVKVFERIEGRPDPVSGRYLLVFEP